MPATTPQQEYKRLRSYLNPYIKGPNTDAVLNALASACSSYLVNNIQAVNDQMYIATASGVYLDERLAQYGISRPPNVGLSDEVFSQIGIAVKNRKQVRDLINRILELMFGDQFTRATSDSATFEPYDLTDGETLIINFDDNHTSTVTFAAEQFANINAATAQEVADAITIAIRSSGQTGTAIATNNGGPNFVQLLSDTIGASSSVTVLGGSAENQLQFASIVPAGGNMSTQWTLSLQSGDLIRFTWSGGANPQLGKVNTSDYVNIYGGGFAASTNEGTFNIVSVVGGAVNVAYFEVENPFGTTGIITQGIDNAILFYNPVRETLLSNRSYAAVYQTQANILQIFIPATTSVVRRSRIGSAHLHYPPAGTFQLNVNPSPGDIFSITSTVSFVAGSDFVIGATPEITVQNIISAIETNIPGLVANANSSMSIQGTILFNNMKNTVLIQSDDPTIILTIAYTGSQNVVASGPLGSPISDVANQPGPYTFDTTQPFTISSINTTLAQELDGTKPLVVQVADSSNFPDSSGYIILGYGTEDQEGPIPYLGTPSLDTIQISPAYTIQHTFQPGTSVFFVTQKSPPTISQDGLDYPFYLTDVVAGRIYAQDLIDSIVAAGITVIFTILYPSDIGLGKWGTPYSEIVDIYGE